MKVHAAPLQGLAVVETEPFEDHRGYFARLFCAQELSGCLDGRQIAQINLSRTAQVGAVRGLHFQYPPHAEIKCVRCIAGRVWDVAVDLRAGSPTFLKWFGQELSAANALMMVIPEGFAHGFQALEEDSQLLYIHTAFYEPSSEGGISCSDARLGIDWPLPLRDMSRRDAAHPPLSDDFRGVAL